jgi:hypothetical protein
MSLRQVFVTNGESIPSDGSAQGNEFVVAQRKEEATEMMKSIGAEAYFLNLEDPGVTSSIMSSDTLWINNFCVRIVKAIRTFRPHIILLMLEGNSRAIIPLDLKTALVGATQEAIRLARNDNLSMADDPLFNYSWNVQQLWTDFGIVASSRSIGLSDYDEKRQRTYEDLSNSLRIGYNSFDATFLKRNSIISKRYRAVYCKLQNSPKTFEDGLSLVSNRFVKLHNIIKRIINTREINVQLSLTISALDSIDRILSTELLKLKIIDREALVQWKMNLERLRVRLLNVQLEVSVSDSIIAPRQLFYIRVEKIDSTFNDDTTYIKFAPNPPFGWIVNEKESLKFPVLGPEEFRVLSSNDITLNYPVSLYGIDKSVIEEKFQFVIYHKGKTRRRSYVAYYEVPLRYSPARVVQVTSPALIWGRDSIVEFYAFSASRDPRRGKMSIEDSVCVGGPHIFETTGKDCRLEDTISIKWLRYPAGKICSINVVNPRTIICTIPVRVLDIPFDSTVSIGIFTRRKSSPIDRAVRRLGIHNYSTLDPKSIPDLHNYQTIILDRNVLLPGNVYGVMESIVSWVSDGGHLVVFPQEVELGLRVARFNAKPPLDFSSEIMMCVPDHPYLSMPNRITEDDWSQWCYSRAWESIDVVDSVNAEILVRNKADQIPLLIDMSTGKGKITLVALNIEQQLENLHEGCFKILANLLRRVNDPR